MTGKHSVYTIYEGHEIMFHVSTLLPYSKDNRQQVIILFCLKFIFLINKHKLSVCLLVESNWTLSKSIVSLKIMLIDKFVDCSNIICVILIQILK